MKQMLNFADTGGLFDHFEVNREPFWPRIIWLVAGSGAWHLVILALIIMIPPVRNALSIAAIFSGADFVDRPYSRTKIGDNVDILDYSVVDDVGTVLNPLLLEGQIRGGIAQGAGQILMEDIVFDPDSGQLLTGSFMDYAMPRAGDLSLMHCETNPVPTKTNPLGVKGAGEAGAVGAMPAIGNALVDALKPLGIREVPMPATPERLWRAIRAAQG